MEAAIGLHNFFAAGITGNVDPLKEQAAAAGMTFTPGITPQGKATALKIDEGISDYAQQIADIGARVGETQAEAVRRIAQTKVEGVMGLQELGRQAAYESGAANIGAGLTASSAQAKLGASGARATGSPLMAARQTAALAQEAAARKTESGNFGISYGGLKLGGSLADINAAATLTTNEYERQRAEAKRKKAELEKNRAEMIKQADLGAVIDFTKFAVTTAAGAGLF